MGREIPDIDENSELDPKCFDRRQEAFALTNRMEVIPCCWLDTQVNRQNFEYQQLLLASRLEDYDSVEEIFLTEEWIEFRNNLSKGKGFPLCHLVCRKRNSPQHKKEIFLESEQTKGYVKST